MAISSSNIRVYHRGTENARSKLYVLAMLTLLGYGALWALLHSPNLIPEVNNGYFTPGSPYQTLVSRISLVKWLGAHSNVGRQILLFDLIYACLLYVFTLAWLRKQGLVLGTWGLVGLTTLVAAPLFLLPRLFSSDIYQYAIFGKIALLYGRNPFIEPPSRFPSDPLLPLLAWPTTASVYGPAWVLVSLPLTALAQLLGGATGIYVLLYKCIGFGSLLGSVALIKRILDQIKPAMATQYTLAFAWHPLVLIEFAGSAHNDSLMVFLILLALLLSMQQRLYWPVVLFVCAGMIKLIACVLVPLYVLHTAQRGGWKGISLFARQCLVAIATATLLYIPFWGGIDTLRILWSAPPLTIMQNSPTARIADYLTHGQCDPLWFQSQSGNPKPITVLGHSAEAGQSNGQTDSTGQLLELHGRVPSAHDLCKAGIQGSIRKIALGLYLVITLGLLLYPTRSWRAFIDRSAWLLLAYVVIAAFHFEPWYATWVMVLTPLMARLRPLLLMWGCFLVFPYAPITHVIAVEWSPIGCLLLWELTRWGKGIIRARASQPAVLPIVEEQR